MRRNDTACLRFLFLMGTQAALGSSFVLSSLQSPPQHTQPCSQRPTPLCMSMDSEGSAVLPTEQQLSTDPFLQQVSHAGALIELLQQLDGGGESNHSNYYYSDRATLLQRLLASQLSHSDGMRGFFVAYLTGSSSSSTPEEDDTTTTVAAATTDSDVVVVIPAILRDVMQKVDPHELVPLACMNVIMPTAMISMHQDPALSEQSRQTAERGSRVLACLLETEDGSDSAAAASSIITAAQPLADANCRAILEVAEEGLTDAANADRTRTPTADPELHRYWADFFAKWGYGEPQKTAIATAIEELLQ